MSDVIALRRNTVSVEFLSKDYRITCEVSVREQPLVDTLNDRLTQFITADNVYISPVNDPTVFLAQRAQAVLRKDQITLAVLRREEDGYARHTIYRNMGHLPVAYTLTAILPGMEIRGGLKLATMVEADTMMMQSPDRFLTTYYATATLVDHREMQFAGGAVLVNREHAQMLFVEKKQEK